MKCQWERYKATRAPMPSQQRQIETCRCTPCGNARTVKAAIVKQAALGWVAAATKERLAVLQWKPEPTPESETAA